MKFISGRQSSPYDSLPKDHPDGWDLVWRLVAAAEAKPLAAVINKPRISPSVPAGPILGKVANEKAETTLLFGPNCQIESITKLYGGQQDMSPLLTINAAGDVRYPPLDLLNQQRNQQGMNRWQQQETEMRQHIANFGS